MTVSPTSWHANAFATVENLLANCAQFRTLMGAADVAAAKAKCVWQVKRAKTDPPYCHLYLLDQGSVSERALRIPQHSDSVTARIVWTELTQTGADDKDKMTLALNAFGQMLAEIDALIGTTGYLSNATRTYEPPAPMPDDDDERGNWDCIITFSWSI